jgi:hypothetical protein
VPADTQPVPADTQPVPADPQPLPMAVVGCGLDESGLREQGARYARLGALADEVARSDLSLVIDLRRDPAPELLRTTLEVERACCSFLAIDYEARARRLRIAIDDPSDRPVLDLIERAVRSGSSPQA